MKRNKLIALGYDEFGIVVSRQYLNTKNKVVIKGDKVVWRWENVEA